MSAKKKKAAGKTPAQGDAPKAPTTAKGMKALEKALDKVDKTKSAPKAPPVRASTRYQGKTLVLRTPLDQSRRVSGSTRYNSLKIVADAGPKGIKAEDYLKAKGTAKYITWFANREQIEIK
jgi:hypothetical protein